MVGKGKTIATLSLGLVLLFGTYGLCPAQSGDNTDVNKRDRSQKEVTADQQGQSKQDLETTSRVRRAIIDDKSLSTYAHNVKIITNGGMVVLKGPVRSEEEKKAVEEKAARVAGQDKIRSELDIAPAKTGKNK